MLDCLFIWTPYRDYSMQMELCTQGVTSWRWCLIGTIYQHRSGQSWHVHVFFYLTLISTICNKGIWKSVHLHTVHQANKEHGPQGVLCHLHCTRSGANHLQLFKDGKKRKNVGYTFCMKYNFLSVWLLPHQLFIAEVFWCFERKTELQKPMVLWTWNSFWKENLQKAIAHLKAPLRSSGAECAALMKSYWGIKAQKAFNVSHSIHYQAFNAGWLGLHVSMKKRAQVQ